MQYRRILSYLFFAISLSLLLTHCRCMYYSCQTQHEAICRELKHQIMFNQASGDKIVVNAQGAALAKLLKAYEDEGC